MGSTTGWRISAKARERPLASSSVTARKGTTTPAPYSWLPGPPRAGVAVASKRWVTWAAVRSGQAERTRAAVAATNGTASWSLPNRHARPADRRRAHRRRGLPDRRTGRPASRTTEPRRDPSRRRRARRHRRQGTRRQYTCRALLPVPRGGDDEDILRHCVGDGRADERLILIAGNGQVDDGRALVDGVPIPRASTAGSMMRASPASVTSRSLTRTGRSRTPGATPWKPTPAAWSAPMMLATAVPCETQSKLPGRRPTRKKSRPGSTFPARLSCGWSASTPESITATVTPAPVL